MRNPPKGFPGRFLASTRGRTLQVLRRRPATVGDLARALDLTHNAIRVHLATLERDGLVREAGKRRGTRKPESLYGLTDEAEQLFPKPYDLILDRFIEKLRDRIGDENVSELAREIGTALAANASTSELTTAEDRATRAAEILDSLGGLAEVIETTDGFLIHGLSCPLRSVSVNHRAACHLAEALLTAAVGVPVRETCVRSGTPRCRFSLENGAGDAGSEQS